MWFELKLRTMFLYVDLFLNKLLVHLLIIMNKELEMDLVLHINTLSDVSGK